MSRFHHLYAPLALTLSVICWGFAPVATRYVVNTSLDPLSLVVLRFTLTALCFVPVFLRLFRERWTRSHLALGILCGLVFILGCHLPVTYGAQWVPAGTAGLIIATEPVWIMLLSAAVDRTPISRRVLAGLGLAAAGVVILVSRQGLGVSGSPTFLLGAALVLFSSIIWSTTAIILRPLSHSYGSLAATGATTLIGTLPLLWFWGDFPTPTLAALGTAGWLAVLFLGVGSGVVAAVLWNYGMAHTPAAQAALFLYLIPLVSVIGGALVLKESVHLVTVLGGLLILSGVIVAQATAGPVPQAAEERS